MTPGKAIPVPTWSILAIVFLLALLLGIRKKLLREVTSAGYE